MSALKLQTTTDDRARQRAAADQRPSLSRLTAVELRKMVDTRAGFWVLIGVAAVSLMFALIGTLNHGGRDGTYVRAFHVASQPLAYLLPVLGVLLICGEWSQRTTLTTFTLVPIRWRVIAAKVLASLLVCLAALVVTVVVALACAAALGNAPGGPGTLSIVVIAQGWLHLCAWMLIGLAFGAAVLTSAPAIVAYLVLPVAISAAVNTIHGLSGVAYWVDAAEALSPLTSHALSATAWAQIGTSLALWLGLPLLIGTWRIRKGEIG